MATRFEREHQWLAATILPEGNRLIAALAGETQCGGKTAQRTTTKNATLRNTGRTILSLCCVDRLRSQTKADLFRTHNHPCSHPGQRHRLSKRSRALRAGAGEAGRPLRRGLRSKYAGLCPVREWRVYRIDVGCDAVMHDQIHLLQTGCVTSATPPIPRRVYRLQRLHTNGGPFIQLTKDRRTPFVTGVTRWMTKDGKTMTEPRARIPATRSTTLSMLPGSRSSKSPPS